MTNKDLLIIKKFLSKHREEQKDYEDAFKMDFIELYADKLGIEYEYDYYYDMYITKIEKVWFNPPLE